eukprot:704995-Pleurochrysis_carterae.AAC.1
MTICTNTDSHWSGSRHRPGGWAHLRGGSGNGALSGQGRPSRAGFRLGSGARVLKTAFRTWRSVHGYIAIFIAWDDIPT